MRLAVFSEAPRVASGRRTKSASRRARGRVAWLLPGLAAWLFLPSAYADARPGWQEGEGATIQATLLRTWAPEDLTVVDGLANVPLAMLAGGTSGAYRFELTVFDAAGNQLYRESWDRQVSERAAAFAESKSSFLLESFRFGVKPGEYVIEMRAYPTDAPDLGSRVRLPLTAYGEKPAASDLFLASRVEPLPEGAGGGSWSITHGGYGISAAARATVPSTEPELYYYLELYDGGAEAPAPAEVVAEVRDGDRVVYRTPPAAVEIVPGGVPFTGKLNLAGLPPGEYSLAMAVASSDGAEEVTRGAEFRVVESASPALAAEGSEEAEYFASLSDAELEATFGGVAVLLTDTERRAYEQLPPEAKRRYLTEFFHRRDPSPGKAGNAFLDEYIERVGVVRSRYGEEVGTEERAPWTTDMGRIYLKYGEPQNRVINHNPSEQGEPTSVVGAGAFGSEPPYEIWQYQNTGFVYLFVQENRFNAWRLVYSTDPDIPSLVDWPRRVGMEALRDLNDNFGINPRLRTGFDN